MHRRTRPRRLLRWLLGGRRPRLGLSLLLGIPLGVLLRGRLQGWW